jgi:hypothetical protein
MISGLVVSQTLLLMITASDLVLRHAVLCLQPRYRGDMQPDPSDQKDLAVHRRLGFLWVLRRVEWRRCSR